MSVVEVRNLRKNYGSRTAVEDVSLSIEEGTIFGIVGPNGAGKSTTVECIAGLRTPSSGNVNVMGFDPSRDRSAIQRLLGVQLQESQLPDRITVEEALELFSSFYEQPADWRELAGFLGLNEQLEVRYKNLSGGQQQRLSIALALIGNPKIAILDELTTGLDPQARREAWSLIERVRDSGVTIILVTHFMDEAERLCDHIAMIDRGRVVIQDSPAGLIEQSGQTQRIRFRLDQPIERRILTELTEVERVEVAADRWTVYGSGALMSSVVAALASIGVVAHELRSDERNLDEAFLALTQKNKEKS